MDSLNCIAGCGNQDVPVYKTLDDGFAVSRIRWCQCGARWKTEESTSKGTLSMAPRPVITDRRRSPVVTADRGQSPVVANDRGAPDTPQLSIENHGSRTESLALGPSSGGGLGVGSPVSVSVSVLSPVSPDRISQPPIRDDRQSDERAADVRAVFDRYRAYHLRAFPRPRPESKEWKAIQARIREGYTPADLCRAIDGYHVSPFHCGENDTGTKYLGLALIMRDGSHVAQGIELAAGPGPVVSEKERRNHRASQGVLERVKQLGFGSGK